MLDIRKDHQEWANNIIISNVKLARHLNLSRETYAVIREIVNDNIENFYEIAYSLKSQMKWADKKDKDSIRKFIKNISTQHVRGKLFNQIMLYDFDYPFNREKLLSDMSHIIDD